MKPILEVKGVSKKFRIHHDRHPYLSMRDKITSLFRGDMGGENEDFWALNNISFDVQPGESIGIIGKNGAGKSTLLKILSKITPPSSGRIIARGRIASLLEVGTGFHAELTGKENVYLNGSILGMRRKEIDSKFDEIVDFSGVEKFLDTPLKHYSSGMQLRLAFAVAAFLEPEILIIDEVLAVGDAEFQKKCIGKMDEISHSQGRTILFVSHNMGAIRNLCSKSIYLRKGELCDIGESEQVIQKYLNESVLESKTKRHYILSRDGSFRLKLPYWVNDEGNEVQTYQFGSHYRLRFEFEFLKPVRSVNPGFAVLNRDGSRIFTSHMIDDPGCPLPENLTGKVLIDTDLDLPELEPGRYQVIFGVADEHNNTFVNPNEETEVVLEIAPTNKIKDGAFGLLWHTSKWSVNR
ncbi:MAG: hypothetical protein RL021_635 [Bacteroidota bacterium]|jgi:lipopolysaccharide transport system ATP-binding protein